MKLPDASNGASKWNPFRKSFIPEMRYPRCKHRGIASEIKFFGEFHQVKAEIFQMESLSAHADRDGLVQWVSEASSLPGRIFLNHIGSRLELPTILNELYKEELPKLDRLLSMIDAELENR